MPGLSKDYEIGSATDAAAIAACRELFIEYYRAIGISSAFGDFEAELAALPGDYAPPAGRLILATQRAAPVACVALRPLFHRDAEMKRLYVRATHRGSGLGRALTVRVIEEARAQGYETLKLDTLPQLNAAIKLYGKLGFQETARYNDNPAPGVRFFALAL